MPERMRTVIASARSAAGEGNHAYAEKRYHEAAEMARGFGLEGELAFNLRHGAMASLERGDPVRAKAAAEEAAEIYDRLEPMRGANYANSIRLVALAIEGLGEGKRACDLWRDARAIYDLHGIAEGVAECDEHLGKAH